MLIHEIRDAPSHGLQMALAVYESKFLYQMGQGRQFRVDYGVDRTRFIRTLGTPWLLLAAEQNGVITGTLDLAARPILLPGGAVEQSVFITEVRVLPEARGKTTAARLLQKATGWSEAQTPRRYSIVNDSTPIKPTAYTGRLGITPHAELARLALFRFPLDPGLKTTGHMAATVDQGTALFAQLAASYCRFAPLDVSTRSSIDPRWLVHPRGTACARLEDRRQVMRLVETGGRELMPAFLSCIAYSDPADARELLAEACATAQSMGYSALRGCLAERQLLELRAVGGAPIPAAGSAVYGTIHPGEKTDWLINAPEM